MLGEIEGAARGGLYLLGSGGGAEVLEVADVGFRGGDEGGAEGWEVAGWVREEVVAVFVLEGLELLGVYFYGSLCELEGELEVLLAVIRSYTQYTEIKSESKGTRESTQERGVNIAYLLDQLLHLGEHLRVLARTLRHPPPQQHEPVVERRGQDAARAVRRHVYIVVALAELLARGVDEEADVREVRGGPA